MTSSRDRHAWNRYDHYQMAHDGHMSAFPLFVVSEGLVWTPTFGRVRVDGRILCLDGYEVHVEKQLEVRMRSGQMFVRTYRYSYHVQLRHVCGCVTKLFRYDNFHAHENHPTPHHRHEFRADVDIVTHVGYDQWPTLAEVLQETEAAWAADLLEHVTEQRISTELLPKTDDQAAG